MSKKSFYEDDYKDCDGCFRPYMKIICHFAKSHIPFEVMADTGCDSGFVLLKGQVKDLELGEKTNDTPIEMGVGDGHVVGADSYIVEVEVGNERREIELLVVDPSNIIKEEKIEESIPVVGRELLNCFDVSFLGEKKRIVLLK